MQDNDNKCCPTCGRKTYPDSNDDYGRWLSEMFVGLERRILAGTKAREDSEKPVGEVE